MSYYFSKILPLGFEQAVERTTAALKEAGFGIITEIDVKDILQKKIGVAFRNYRILGACNPALAYEGGYGRQDRGRRDRSRCLHAGHRQSAPPRSRRTRPGDASERGREPLDRPQTYLLVSPTLSPEGTRGEPAPTAKYRR
jgi:hypothetical protein